MKLNVASYPPFQLACRKFSVITEVPNIFGEIPEAIFSEVHTVLPMVQVAHGPLRSSG